MTNNAVPSVIIIPNWYDDEDDRIIGPFPTGEAASDWGFKHIPHGIEWHWYPIEAPAIAEAS